MYGINTEDPKIALAGALTYWCYRCRDANKSPAMGLKTWEFVTTSIKNAAIPSANLTDYLENLCNKLVVPHLRPAEWTFIVKPTMTIQRVMEDGRILEVYEDQDNDKLKFWSYEDIIKDLSINQGITDRDILETCKKYPHVIATFARLRADSDKVIGLETIEEDAIDV